MKVYISAFFYEIFHSVEEENINLAQDQLDICEIYILIGSQNLWNLLRYKQVKGDSGITTIPSRLGFILSGPYKKSKN